MTLLRCGNKYVSTHLIRIALIDETVTTKRERERSTVLKTERLANQHRQEEKTHEWMRTKHSHHQKEKEKEKENHNTEAPVVD